MKLVGSVNKYVETSSPGTLKVMPRNLNEIVRSYIQLQDVLVELSIFYFSLWSGYTPSVRARSGFNDVDNRPEQAGNTWMQPVVFCTERKFVDKVPFIKKRINRILNRHVETKF